MFLNVPKIVKFTVDDASERNKVYYHQLLQVGLSLAIYFLQYDRKT